ncbi:murein biosynthesis integral membrane protein MurJ [Hyphobacterium sp.]|uniref:murein biosynthesis integral membrane protein MurJ n=1 Tax=Hyphobacterium sp. TaxID=2004662 RepID=UPI003BAC95BB
MKLLRSTFVIGGFTAISRVLGFIREMLLAAALGAGPVAEAFVVAFRFPNLFRRFFAEGAFNSAYVPLYSRTLEGDGEAEARTFARDTLSVMIVVLAALTVLAQIFMPWIMRVIAPGFLDDPGLFGVAVLFTQITMPYLLLVSLTAMMGGTLNAHDRFALSAAAPIALNVIMVAVLLLAPDDPQTTGLWITIAVPVSGVVQAAMLYWGCRRSGIGLALRVPRLTPKVKRLIWLGVPGAIAGGVTQINIVISQLIATLQDGAVALLYFADRLYQLPLGVIGIAMGVALLPMLSKRLRAGDDAGAKDTLNRALEISMALTLPATAALIAMPGLLVEGLFQRGAFTAENAVATKLAVQAFAVGLPAFVLIKVFSPGFFAREDTATPMKFAAVSMVLNVVIGAAAFFWIREFAPDRGHVGLAGATALAGWVNAALLAVFLARRGGFSPDKRFFSALPGLVNAALVAGGVMAGLEFARPLIVEMALGSRLLAAILASAAGGIIYLVFALALRGLRVSELRNAFRRG